MNAAVARHAFAAVVYFRYPRGNRDLLAIGRNQPIKFQIETGGLMANSEAHAGYSLRTAREDAASLQSRFAVHNEGRNQNGAEGRPGPASI
jgi:hypothetical protein